MSQMVEDSGSGRTSKLELFAHFDGPLCSRCDNRISHPSFHTGGDVADYG